MSVTSAMSFIIKGKAGIDRRIDGALPEHEVFWHTVGAWNITLIAQAAAADPLRWPPGDMPLTADLVHYIRTMIGVEADHLAQLDAAALARPLIAVAMPDGSFLLIDGHHRVLKAVSLGRATLPCRILTWGEAQAFAVTSTKIRRGPKVKRWR